MYYEITNKQGRITWVMHVHIKMKKEVMRGNGTVFLRSVMR
jgi:hypothetical protein